MKKLLLPALASLIVLAGCTSTKPITATSNELGPLVGTATAGYLFGFIPIPFNQDHGIARAAREGGITKISTVDEKTFNFPGIWRSTTTVVTGSN
ncbi:MAG TPA: hypothetical protein DEO40_00135 [Treponema sp.]|jgi:hypothetical protein|nr:hypothetical protein [Treponema sp.]HBB42107.1 hypothetical protein [Treponema sp.]HCA19067.1 hypothetical protein [Treponema sp.]